MGVASAIGKSQQASLGASQGAPGTDKFTALTQQFSPETLQTIRDLGSVVAGASTGGFNETPEMMKPVAMLTDLEYKQQNSLKTGKDMTENLSRELADGVARKQAEQTVKKPEEEVKKPPEDIKTLDVDALSKVAEKLLQNSNSGISDLATAREISGQATLGSELMTPTPVPDARQNGQGQNSDKAGAKAREAMQR